MSTSIQTAETAHSAAILIAHVTPFHYYRQWQQLNSAKVSDKMVCKQMYYSHWIMLLQTVLVKHEGGSLGFAHLHTLAIWANDEGPSARCNGHANGIMRNVMRVRLALFMECVVSCWHLHHSTTETQVGALIQLIEMRTHCQIIAECQPMHMQSRKRHAAAIVVYSETVCNRQIVQLSSLHTLKNCHGL